MLPPPKNPPKFLDEFLSRNNQILSVREQAALKTMKVLVAGCGSVGGSVVHPLVRMGVATLVLADPEVYDVTNLNRQACFYADLGASKVQVLERQCQAINPLVRIKTYPEGLTLENYKEILQEVNIIFDGVDIEASPWVKYLLHQEACRLHIPIICGSDYGGKPTLYVFDYRRSSKPFYGKISAESHQNLHLQKALKWLGYFHYSTDFLPIIADHFKTGAPWPQIGYCVAAMGALGSRTLLDVYLHKPTRHVISTDIHLQTQKIHQRILSALRYPLELIKMYWSFRQNYPKIYKAFPIQKPRQPEPTAIAQDLLAVCEAIRLAPSPFQSQPWQVKILQERTLRLSWNPNGRLKKTDEQAKVVCLALGCAIESAQSIAHITFTASAMPNVLAENWFAGDLRVDGLRDETYQKASGLLAYRQNDPGPFLRQKLPGEILEKLQKTATASGHALLVTDCPKQMKKIRDLVYRSVWQELQNRESLAERSHLSDCRNIAKSGALLLLVSQLGQQPTDFIEHGQAIMKVWNRATEENLVIHPHYLINLSETMRQEILKVFGSAMQNQIITLLRLGYGKKALIRT